MLRFYSPKSAYVLIVQWIITANSNAICISNGFKIISKIVEKPLLENKLELCSDAVSLLMILFRYIIQIWKKTGFSMTKPIIRWSNSPFPLCMTHCTTRDLKCWGCWMFCKAKSCKCKVEYCALSIARYVITVKWTDTDVPHIDESSYSLTECLFYTLLNFTISTNNEPFSKNTYS